MENRMAEFSADHTLLIIKRPEDWEPAHVEDIPSSGEILARFKVASLAEARDDMRRCNQLALSQGLDSWAVVVMADVEL